MGCGGSTPLPVDIEALRAHITQLSALAKMPYLAVRTFPSASLWNAELIMEVNGVDAEKIGPELLKLMQGFYPEAAVSNMATVRLQGPPYKQDYRFQYKAKTNTTGLSTWDHQHVGGLVSRREAHWNFGGC